MIVRSVHTFLTVLPLSLSLALFLGATNRADAQLVPGSGHRVESAGDDFEDPEWEYYANGPKSSFNLDKQRRLPRGRSKNGIWFESKKRGQPEQIKRVETPEGGLPGSEGAMSIRSLHTGRPGRPSYRFQQDDLQMNLTNSLGGSVSVEHSPSVVVRLYMPPFEEWEQVHGTTFGLRASVMGRGPYIPEEGESRKRGFFSRKRGPVVDQFFPGMFIQFVPKAVNRAEDAQDSARFLIRANERMQDVEGPTITETGWWTLGMSFTPDGRVHYYISQGVDDLTAEDHVASFHSQGVRCYKFNTLMFNVVNQDNGRTWSTEWIIDDPELYFIDENDRAREASAPWVRERR